jgi:dCTP deaminase
MSLLSYTEICDLIEDGVVQNAMYEHVNSASLDLTLGKIVMEEVGKFDYTGYQPSIKRLRDRDSLNFKTINLEETPNQEYILKPGQFILAQTKEVFNLPSDISSEYKLKSSMARMGLDHLNAGWCDAGWHGSVLTLEFRNLTTYHDIAIRMGDKVGQMIFFRHLPVPIEKSYAQRGTYNHNKTTSAARKEAK